MGNRGFFRASEAAFTWTRRPARSRPFFRSRNHISNPVTLGRPERARYQVLRKKRWSRRSPRTKVSRSTSSKKSRTSLSSESAIGLAKFLPEPRVGKAARHIRPSAGCKLMKPRVFSRSAARAGRVSYGNPQTCTSYRLCLAISACLGISNRKSDRTSVQGRRSHTERQAKFANDYQVRLTVNYRERSAA